MHLVNGIVLFVFFSCFWTGKKANEFDDQIAFKTSNQGGLQVAVANASTETKYLIYDVNPGEGFNLRRDVYLRASNLVKLLLEKQKWVLVLPPWRRLYHWRSQIDQNGLPWKTFFDLKSMNDYVPVLDFEDFVKQTGSYSIDEIIYLQRYSEGWKDGVWEEKIDDRPCIDNPVYHQGDDGNFRGYFWDMPRVFARKFKCVSAQGTSAILRSTLEKSNSRSIFIDRFEEVLHIHYGQQEYWKARRSLVFAKHLRNEGDSFRREKLNSTDEEDKTVMDSNWRNNKKKEGAALGGPYLAVHYRRADFLYAHPEKVPSLDGFVKQIKKLLKKHKLKKVFIATDTESKDLKYLKKRLPLIKYVPKKAVLKEYGDGGVAIIDQWICAHARFFIGTCESTFSFRIHEERDILGFHADKTFNCLCGDKNIDKCEQPSRWRIVY